jgi:hypothetical protein
MNHFPKEENSLNFFNVLQAIVITRREVLSQTAWCMRMPAATDTLKESTMPFIGILQCKSDNSRASSLIPLQERLATKFRKLCLFGKCFDLKRVLDVIENMKHNTTCSYQLENIS